MSIAATGSGQSDRARRKPVPRQALVYRLRRAFGDTPALWLLVGGAAVLIWGYMRFIGGMR